MHSAARAEDLNTQNRHRQLRREDNLAIKQTTRCTRVASAFLFLLLLGSIAWLRAQQPPGAYAPSAVRILTPKEGELLTTNVVHCKYQLVEPASAATNPTFQLQLDDRDPVRTIITDQTFTGLKEGRHVILIMVLDANNTPIPGTRIEVHFRVPPPNVPRPSSLGAAAPAGRSAVHHLGVLRTRATTQARAGQSSPASTAAAPQSAPSSGQGELPDNGSPLPLLAVVCGGALAGGTLSVLRTRGRRTRG